MESEFWILGLRCCNLIPFYLVWWFWFSSLLTVVCLFDVSWFVAIESLWCFLCICCCLLWMFVKGRVCYSCGWLYLFKGECRLLRVVIVSEYILKDVSCVARVVINFSLTSTLRLCSLNSFLYYGSVKFVWEGSFSIATFLVVWGVFARVAEFDYASLLFLKFQLFCDGQTREVEYCSWECFPSSLGSGILHWLEWFWSLVKKNPSPNSRPNN